MHGHNDLGGRQGWMHRAQFAVTGARVEIRVCQPEIPAELQSELDAWQQASADGLKLVERLAQEGETSEKR